MCGGKGVIGARDIDKEVENAGRVNSLNGRGDIGVFHRTKANINKKLAIGFLLEILYLN